MVNFVFSIINLIVIAIISIYLFYKYMLPSITSSFKQDKAFISDLKKEEHEIIIQQKEIKNSIIEQEKLGKNLSLKVSQWANITDKQKLEKQEELIAEHNNLEKKIKAQSQNYQRQKITQKITPYVVKILELELKDYFENTINVKNYFDKIFNSLNTE